MGVVIIARGRETPGQHNRKGAIMRHTPTHPGTQATVGLIPETAVEKVRQAYLDLGLEVSLEQAQRDLIGAVNLVKLVLTSGAENGDFAPYYMEARHD
ncbi:MAG: hypothetical protein EG828_06640 [Deltaproteobacteria bacterium]|nr:hypothetical protein [Deltaproteobacteria bacterium]